MLRLILLILLSVSGSLAILRAERDSTSDKVEVVTLNLWQGSGGLVIEDGLRKAANFINRNPDSPPDIVALQETGDSKDKSDQTVAALLEYLPSGWTGVSHCNGDMAIITRHYILGAYEHVRCGMNVRIELDSGREVSVWAMHLTIHPYGPYRAMNGQEGTAMDEILAGETKRVKDIVELLKHPRFVHQIKNSDNIPVIVAGCFNTPSHLDWTYLARHNNSNLGFVIEWPVTRLLSIAAGMTDAQREYKPDPVKYPGWTWPKDGSNFTAHATRKFDRIDYIFYRGSMKPTFVEALGSAETSDQWKKSEHPSDHSEVKAVFEFTPRKFENRPSFSIPEEYLGASISPIDKCPMKILS